MNTVSINVEQRPSVGSKSARQARKDGLIPCVMYGGADVKHFTTTKRELKPLVYTPDFKVAEVTVDGKTYRAIIKNIQFHPVNESIEHVDFLELVDGKSVNVELPVAFVGTSPGVKNGGKLQQSLRRVKVKTTPENLVDELVLDISKLKLGQAIRVRDIKVIDGMEIMSAPGTPVATVEIPRALRSAEAKADLDEDGEGEGGEAEGEGGEES